MIPTLHNSKSEWPKVFSCSFLEAGIVSYEDSDCGIALLRKETIDKMLNSFIGKPVCIEHHSINPDNYLSLKTDGVIVGNVIRVWFNPVDGWFWADFIVETEAGRLCIEEKGYSVSCAYNVLNVAEGGLWHDIKYDGEITDGSFTHLALVEQPRYEDARITKSLPAMLINGKLRHMVVENKNQEKNMQKVNWKFWEKKENSKEETDKLANLHVEIEGRTMPLGEVLNAVERSGILRESKNAKTVMCSKGDIVDIEGHTYPIDDLVNSHAKMNSAESDEDKAKREKAELEAKNAKDEEDKKATEKENSKKIKEAEELANAKKLEEEEKLNGKKSFTDIHNAKPGEEEGSVTTPLSRAERAQRWHAKHSKKEAA